MPGWQFLGVCLLIFGGFVFFALSEAWMDAKKFGSILKGIADARQGRIEGFMGLGVRFREDEDNADVTFKLVRHGPLCIEASCPTTVDFRLWIATLGNAQSYLKSHRLQRVSVNSDGFDSVFEVLASDQERARKVLSEPVRRMLLDSKRHATTISCRSGDLFWERQTANETSLKVLFRSGYYRLKEADCNQLLDLFLRLHSAILNSQTK